MFAVMERFHHHSAIAAEASATSCRTSLTLQEHHTLLWPSKLMQGGFEGNCRHHPEYHCQQDHLPFKVVTHLSARIRFSPSNQILHMVSTEKFACQDGIQTPELGFWAADS